MSGGADQWQAGQHCPFAGRKPFPCFPAQPSPATCIDVGQQPRLPQHRRRRHSHVFQCAAAPQLRQLSSCLGVEQFGFVACTQDSKGEEATEAMRYRAVSGRRQAGRRCPLSAGSRAQQNDHPAAEHPAPPCTNCPALHAPSVSSASVQPCSAPRRATARTSSRVM